MVPQWVLCHRKVSAGKSGAGLQRLAHAHDPLRKVLHAFVFYVFNYHHGVAGQLSQRCLFLHLQLPGLAALIEGDVQSPPLVGVLAGGVGDVRVHERLVEHAVCSGVSLQQAETAL